jgi:hypothetical protein
MGWSLVTLISAAVISGGWTQHSIPSKSSSSDTSQLLHQLVNFGYPFRATMAEVSQLPGPRCKIIRIHRLWFSLGPRRRDNFSGPVHYESFSRCGGQRPGS